MGAKPEAPASDDALELALALVEEGTPDAQALASYELPALDGARTQCLTGLRSRPPNSRSLLRALDLLDEAIEAAMARRDDGAP
ncbi:MAG: hypothetical protein E6G17_05445 [Actinobacteria bacterium]|nr:MAG: hypothetical protein E6G17_05445 [Actinomycetota bacterium]